jgi:hypothetical protein
MTFVVAKNGVAGDSGDEAPSSEARIGWIGDCTFDSSLVTE